MRKSQPCFLTICILCTCLSLQAQTELSSKNVNIQQKSITYRQFLKEIRKQTDFPFTYNEKLINWDEKISVNFKDVPVDDVLRRVFKPKGLTWHYDKPNILIVKISPMANHPSLQPNDTEKKEKPNELDEVVVNGYSTQIKRYITGNIITIKERDLERSPMSNPLLVLQGLVPGLLVGQTGGMLGTEIKVQIRGKNSLNNGTMPLFIVDGIPINPVMTEGLNSETWGASSSVLSFINVSDIESVDVLKDADATAIYGSRGANGVILITMKKGKIGKPRLQIYVNSGSSDVRKMLEMLNNSQYRSMREEAFTNDGTMATPRSAPDLYWDSTRHTDWQDYLIGHHGETHSIRTSVYGGNDSMHLTYLLSGNYQKENTVYPGNFNNEKFGFHGSSSIYLVDSTVRGSVMGSYFSTKTFLPKTDFINSINLPPNTPPTHLPNGMLDYTWLNIQNNVENGPFFNAKVVNRFLSGVFEYEPLKGLVLKVSVGEHKLSGNSETTTRIAATDPTKRDGVTGSTIFSRYTSYSRIIEPWITYNRQVKNGKLETLLGGTYQSAREERETLKAYGFKEDWQLSTLSYADSISGSAFKSRYKYLALFGRVQYNWKDQYLFQGSIRTDGSSRFGRNTKFTPFWALGAGWIFTEAAFAKFIKHTLSFGKLRATYGTTGNDQIGDYQYLGQYELIGLPYQGVNGYVPSSLANNNLGWELTRKLEFGLDLGVWNDRWMLSAVYYGSRSSKQLTSYPVPSTTGMGTIFGNIPAKIQNTGWEFSMRTQNVQTKRFSWSSTVNFTAPKNKLASFPGSTEGTNLDGLVGKPVTAIYVPKTLGVDVTGGFVFADKNGQPVTASGDVARVALIDLAPKFYGSMQHRFTFGKLELDIVLVFIRQLGVDDRYDPSYMAGYPKNQDKFVLTRWQRPGDQSMMQRFTQLGALRSGYLKMLESDVRYVDASFIRCKNLNLSWHIDPKKKKVKKCTFSLEAQNLFVLTKYKGFDPETQTRQVLPPLRTITTSIKLEF